MSDELPPSFESLSLGGSNNPTNPTTTTTTTTTTTATGVTSASSAAPQTASTTSINTSSAPPAFADDDTPISPIRRRTSSFEYNDDGPSQFDDLELKPAGSTKLSPLFLDLIRGKIREAERQLHFAHLSLSHNDLHDATKRCSCALQELDYARQRVHFPPALELLDVRIHRATAISSLTFFDSGDAVLESKKAEACIEKGFQMLGELVDWFQVRERHSAIEKLEEFLPMGYFDGKDIKNTSSTTTSGSPEQEPGADLEFNDVMGLWYTMMMDHGRITLKKAKWKEREVGKAPKIENYAKAYKLLTVGWEGLGQVTDEAEKSGKEYKAYEGYAQKGVADIASRMVHFWKQDELVEMLEENSKLDLTEFKIAILKARQAADDLKKEGGAANAKGKAKVTAGDDAAGEEEEPNPVYENISEEPPAFSDEGKGKDVKGKGKAKAGDSAASTAPPPGGYSDGLGPPPDVDEEWQTADRGTAGLPSYNDSTKKVTHGDGEEWVVV